MAKWFFEPGHTAAEFCARHMMVSHVRGHFKNVHGEMVFDPKDPRASRVTVRIDAKSLWTGEPQRDDHLRSADFLDAEHYPEIAFTGDQVEVVGDHDYRLTGALTMRGVTREVTLKVRYLGQWATPWWEDGVDKGPKTRTGFLAEASINRHEWGVSWNGTLDKGGIVVSNTVDITIDVEAILAE
ncbi:MAG TPA: YceI family protein [Bryobacterales bacterium]|nr:YceI family protein [Bryobacterales bacterium]